jgi:hypothetical protein
VRGHQDVRVVLAVLERRRVEAVLQQHPGRGEIALVTQGARLRADIGEVGRLRHAYMLRVGELSWWVMKLVLDLHDIYNRGGEIDRALNAIVREAVAKKAPLVEIISGKGSGALKKKVLRFLEQKEIKALYHRVEKDSKNFGRIFVHFRH